jgi:hypothetical protein
VTAGDAGTPLPSESQHPPIAAAAGVCSLSGSALDPRNSGELAIAVSTPAKAVSSRGGLTVLADSADSADLPLTLIAAIVSRLARQ